LVLAVRLPLRFHAEHDTGQRAAGPAGRLLERDFDLLAAGLVQKLAERRVRGQVQGERLERPLDRVLAVVVDGRRLAAAGVLYDETLDQVVHVPGRKSEVDPGRAVDGPLALEVADAGGEQHDVRQRQSWCGRGRRRVAGRGGRTEAGAGERGEADRPDERG